MQLTNVMLTPNSPLRRVARPLAQRFRLGHFEQRVGLLAVERPHYAYCVLHAAKLAKRLGYREISVVEFGVAGGNGLVALEKHAVDASRDVGIDIQVFGFDTGVGLPPPSDYRDLPYHWKSGFYKMDEKRLRRTLERAQLVIGDLRTTSKEFFATYDPPPIAAAMFDVDLYSSTCFALEAFDAEPHHRLPRVFCYFDDIVGGEIELYNDFTGQRLAIEEFNQSHDTRKLSKAYHLVCRRRVEGWYHQIYILHDFSHPRYVDFVSGEDQHLRLA